MTVIDKRAEIHPDAKIADKVTIGPWSVIGADVEIDEGTWIGPHVVINGPTRIGKDNKFYQFSSIGEAPQDLTYAGEPTSLEIGNNNIIREHCTISRGTMKGGGATKIGNDNFFMACSHIAHDCVVEDETIFANYAALSGHVIVKKQAKIGAYSGIHQFCTIGEHCFVARATYVGKDALPYLLVAGNTASVCGLNTVGLKRGGFSPEVIEHLRRAYKIIFRQGLSIQQAIAELIAMLPECEDVRALVHALQNTQRGILR